MNKYVFLERGNQYTQVEGNFTTVEKLERGIYNMGYDSFKQEIYLEKIGEKFEFPFKLYGVHQDLVKRIKRYFANTTSSNLGVLLNGTRGTGKTVTSKVIANELDLPVIIINAQFPRLVDWIAKVQQDCIFFFDEFEKNFRSRRNDNDEETTGQDLLSIMDGVYNSEHRHVFLLTTNNLRINENFMSRPSRIRYTYTFNSVLDQEVLAEVINDKLEDKSKAPDLIRFINTLEISTIDILNSLIQEMNIQDCGIDEIKPTFNVETAEFSMYYYYKDIYDDSEENDQKYNLKNFQAECALPYDERQKKYVRMDDLTSPVKFEDLKVGDEIEYSFNITEIDLASKCLVARSDYYHRTRYYNVTSCHSSNSHKYSIVL